MLEVPYIPFLTENNTRTGFVEDGDFSRLAAEARDLWLRKSPRAGVRVRLATG